MRMRRVIYRQKRQSKENTPLTCSCGKGLADVASADARSEPVRRVVGALNDLVCGSTMSERKRHQSEQGEGGERRASKATSSIVLKLETCITGVGNDRPKLSTIGSQE